MSFPTEPRPLVADLVRLIGAQAVYPTTVRFGEQDGTPVPVALTRTHPLTGLNYRRLLATEAQRERAEPCGLRPIACALILPDPGIAYIQHATGTVATVPLHPLPHDDPATRDTIAAGLRTLMQVLQDGRPARPPSGRGFATGPHNSPPPHPPAPSTTDSNRRRHR